MCCPEYARNGARSSVQRHRRSAILLSGRRTSLLPTGNHRGSGKSRMLRKTTDASDSSRTGHDRGWDDWSTTMASVTLSGVRKIYHEGVEQVAVDRVDLDVKDGEFVVLVGPSGCGKSTTLRMIAGLESVSAGTVKIGDRIVNDVPPKERDIAMVFQNYALYPHMTVRENLGFALKLTSMSPAEITDRVKIAATTLGLDDYLDRKPRQLSGGQRQRVALGRAIVRQPQVFLFDEPLSNLDAQMRVSMRPEIARLHQELKVTMIYATPDQVEASTLAY